MNKFLRYSLSLALVLIANLSLMAAKPYKVLTFPDDNKANNSVNDYTSSWEAKVGTDTWTITNFNNYQWKGWTYIKCGSKKLASIATIESPIFDKGIGCVVVTFDKVTAANVNSISVTFETNDEDALTTSQTVDVTPKAGEIIFKNTDLPDNKVKCTLTVNCKKSSNGIVQISKIEYYKVGDEPEVEPIQTVDNIAAFKAIGAKKQATLTLTNAQVQYVNGTNDMYIVDATGGIDIFKSDLKYTAGQVLNGTITATYDVFKTLPQLINITENTLTATDGIVTPVEMSVEDAALAENACKLVKITNVKAVKVGNDFYTDANKTIQIFDKFKLSYSVDTENECDYTGIIIPFNSQMELAPTVTPVTSNINGITIDDADANAPVYNLAGQKVSESYKGVVIKAGKKFVQK